MLQQENQDETNRVRQGVTGHNVRYVLAVGLIGVIVVFMIAYWYLLGSAPSTSGTT
jgi:hypothetical protein